MKRKIQITVDETIHDWFKEQADVYGISVSGLINMSMAEYRMQKEAIGQMPQMMEMLSQAMKLETIKNLEDIENK